MQSLKAVVVSCAVLTGAALLAAPAAAEPTLATVKKRGAFSCGINGQLPGFSVRDTKGQ